jgi:hypothetical protein
LTPGDTDVLETRKSEQARIIALLNAFVYVAARIGPHPETARIEV